MRILPVCLLELSYPLAIECQVRGQTLDEEWANFGISGMLDVGLKLIDFAVLVYMGDC